jgi:outer membrane protein assembly factor BamB
MRDTVNRMVGAILFVLVAGCGLWSSEPPAVMGPPFPAPIAAVPVDELPETDGYWPQFLGPAGDGISSDTGLLRQWPDGGPRLLWTARGIGEGYSSVAIADGRIVTAGNIGRQTVVTAMDTRGQILWQSPNGPAWTGSYPGTRSTPTIDGDRIYHQNPTGDLVCLLAADGTSQWTVNVLERFGSSNIRWALAESLLIDGPRVISTPGGPNTAVVALDKMTGETVWQSESADGDLTAYASPALIEYQGRRLILTMTALAFIGVDADTGKLYWRWPHRAEYDINVLKPIFHEGRVFISSGYGTGSQMLQLIVDDQRVAVEPLWSNREFDNHQDGTLLIDGYLYGSNHRGTWFCLDWDTGAVQYRNRGIGRGSLTYADGMLFMLSQRSEVGLVECTPDEYRLVSQFRLPKKGDGPSWAYPVVCGGRLYIRHGNYLYCYDVSKGGTNEREG